GQLRLVGDLLLGTRTAPDGLTHTFSWRQLLQHSGHIPGRELGRLIAVFACAALGQKVHSMLIAGTLILPHRLPALGDSFANALFAIKIQAIFASSANAEFR